MKFWKWLLAGAALILSGMLVFSYFHPQTGPVDTSPIFEQSRRQSQLIDDLDPFSGSAQSLTKMLQGTVGY